MTLGELDKVQQSEPDNPDLKTNQHIYLEFNKNLNDLVDTASQWSVKAFDCLNLFSKPDSEIQKVIWNDFSETMLQLFASNSDSSSKQFSKHNELVENHLKLYQNMCLSFLGEKKDDLISPDKHDKRFNDPEWSENPYFNYIKQCYLLNADYLNRQIEEIDNEHVVLKNKADFYLRQWINAMSPTNFMATNPEVIKKTFETSGLNLVNGLAQFNQDFKNSIDNINISISDNAAFKLGQNIAATEGKVIFQNSTFQLIHYKPTCEKVFTRPLLIVPPWINKYYVLDLRESNSFVKWALDQGHNVFLISWVNPDKSYSEITFEDYVNLSVIEALDQVELESGSNKINCIGYCLGGALLATTVGYLEAVRDHRVASTTYLATLIDFSIPGEIGVFINATTLDAIEETIKHAGVFDGRAMAVTFNLLRENELYWNYFVNNYLKGEKPSAFDLLYWSSDSTNIPAALHTFILKELYLKNRLAKANDIKINDTPINLSKITSPAYFISPKLDHIAKWESTYLGAQIYGQNTRFVLGESGHIAGIINPPNKGKYDHWVNSSNDLTVSPSEWLSKTAKVKGSWWNDWQKWIEGIDSEKIDAPTIGSGKLKPIEDAPGSYVRKRIDSL